VQTFHFTLKDDFCIFIEKRGGSYFQLWGRGRIAYAPGIYVVSSVALREMHRLRSLGYKEQLGQLGS